KLAGTARAGGPAVAFTGFGIARRAPLDVNPGASSFIPYARSQWPVALPAARRETGRWQPAVWLLLRVYLVAEKGHRGAPARGQTCNSHAERLGSSFARHFPSQVRSVFPRFIPR